MRRRVASIVWFTGVVFSTTTAGQTTDPNQSQPTAAAAQGPAVADRTVSWKLLIPNILNDQKRIWTFPVHAAEGENWIPTAAVLGTAAGLVALDPIEAHYFRNTTTFHTFDTIFAGNATIAATIAAPVSFYVAGRIRKDSKLQHTGLLAGEAVADAEVVVTALKYATRRQRPENIPAHGNFYDSWYDGGSVTSGNGSFPSGHSIAAFAIATVVARRYGNRRWVPYVAYGMAALVGFSRLSLSAHFFSDVFVGGALGYSIGRFAVLRQ